MYFSGGRSHIYEYGLSVNFTRTSSFCAGRVFIHLVESRPVSRVDQVDLGLPSRSIAASPSKFSGTVGFITSHFKST